MAAEKIKGTGIGLGLQMMTGLPGDTREKSLYTAGELVRMGADFVRIYPCVVLFETELYELYKRGEYTPPALEEAVETAADAFMVFERAGVEVIRIGLQQTEGLEMGAAGGAYHPALGALVRSRVLRRKIQNIINATDAKTLNIRAGNRDVSEVVGHGRENIIYFEDILKIPVMLEVFEGHGIFVNNEKLC